MKILIFEYNYGGHYVEYIRHLINYSQKYIKNDIVDIVVPKEYNKHVINGEYNLGTNINIHYLPKSDIKKCNSTANKIMLSRIRCKILLKYIMKLGVDNVITLWATPYLFGLLDIFPDYVNLHSIEYVIPFRRSSASLKNKLSDIIKYIIFSKSKILKTLFLLNDEVAPNHYNNKYHTTKFKYLTDPIEKIHTNAIAKVRDDRIVILHAGSLKKEKGTFEILDSIRYLKPTDYNKIHLIICGKGVTPAINEIVCSKIKEISKQIKIDFYNGYVDSDFLESLYQCCDYVLIPYHNSYQSSGNLGHAACYNKPVIGSGSGLLGELIRKYELGITLDTISSYSIGETLSQLSNRELITINGDNYVSKCTPEIFAKTIIFNLNTYSYQ